MYAISTPWTHGKQILVMLASIFLVTAGADWVAGSNPGDPTPPNPYRDTSKTPEPGGAFYPLPEPVPPSPYRDTSKTPEPGGAFPAGGASPATPTKPPSSGTDAKTSSSETSDPTSQQTSNTEKKEDSFITTGEPLIDLPLIIVQIPFILVWGIVSAPFK